MAGADAHVIGRAGAKADRGGERAAVQRYVGHRDLQRLVGRVGFGEQAEDAERLAAAAASLAGANGRGADLGAGHERSIGTLLITRSPLLLN